METLLAKGVLAEDNDTITFDINDQGIHPLEFLDEIIHNANDLVPTTINTVAIQGATGRITISKYALLKLKKRQRNDKTDFL